MSQLKSCLLGFSHRVTQESQTQFALRAKWGLMK